jgi:putative membrane protein
MTDGGEPATGTEPLTGRAFRLHPLSVPYRIVENGLGLAVVALFAGSSVFGAIAGTIGVAAGVALGVGIGVAVVGYGVAYYRRYEYELTADTFDIRSGVFGRREREIPLRRIQNVDISQNVIQRALGIAEVRLETAGASGSEAHLKFVGEARANQLQAEISRLSRSGEDGEAAEAVEAETVFEISDRELGILALVSADAQLLSILFVVGTVLFPTVGSMVDDQLLFPVEQGLSALFGPFVTLVGILLIGLVYGVLRATVYYGFTLRRTGEELRYERGLLQRYSGTIPLSKIQSLTVEENVLARALGYASLDIETAGGSGGESQQGGSQSAIPIAERERVLELTNSIEPVGELQFERPPKRARQRYAARYTIVLGIVVGLLYAVQAMTTLSLLWWAPLAALVLVPVAAHLKWKGRGYHVGDRHVVTRNGFWVRRLKVVPYYRVQTVSSSATVFQRRRRLGTVTIDTAGSRSLVGSDAKAVDVGSETAETLRERVGEELYESLRRRRRRRRGDSSAPGTVDREERAG